MFASIEGIINNDDVPEEAWIFEKDVPEEAWEIFEKDVLEEAYEIFEKSVLEEACENFDVGVFSSEFLRRWYIIWCILSYNIWWISRSIW
jgi:hypothetical protein